MHLNPLTAPEVIARAKQEEAIAASAYWAARTPQEAREAHRVEAAKAMAYRAELALLTRAGWMAAVA